MHQKSLLGLIFNKVACIFSKVTEQLYVLQNTSSEKVRFLESTHCFCLMRITQGENCLSNT